jgi:hypothetical protein
LVFGETFCSACSGQLPPLNPQMPVSADYKFVASKPNDAAFLSAPSGSKVAVSPSMVAMPLPSPVLAVGPLAFCIRKRQKIRPEDADDPAPKF